MFRKWISFPVFSLFVTTVVAPLFFAPKSAQAGMQISALDLDGRAVEPFQTARGKVVVFIFVRTDCPVSNRYAPTIQQLSAKYLGQAAFWLVYPSKSESADTIRKHDREFRYEFPALRDPQRVLVKLSSAKITPEAAVFDTQRRLVYHGRIDNWYEDFGHARKAATTHEVDDAVHAALDGRTLAVAERPAVGCYIADLE